MRHIVKEVEIKKISKSLKQKNKPRYYISINFYLKLLCQCFLLQHLGMGIHTLKLFKTVICEICLFNVVYFCSYPRLHILVLQQIK